MRQWKSWTLGLLACAGLTSALWAQIPAAPVVPAGPVVAAPVAAAPAAAPANLWTFLCCPPGKLEACKAKFCACPLGQLINQMMAPAAALSGGIIGNCCPPNAPNPADLALPSDTPAGAAAQIKADEAAAKKRREAVRYLGTVDCHYWPEAQKALIVALRADRNECVRLEAAIALGRGCCCTKNTIIALSITVAGSDRDGNPSENCERVRAAAAASLSHCLGCLADVVPLSLEPTPTNAGPPPEGPRPVEKIPVPPPPPLPVPPPPGVDGKAVTPASYYQQVDKVPMKDIVIVARAVLDKAKAAAKATAPGHGPETGPSAVAHGGALNIIASAVAQNGTHTSKTGNPGNSGNPGTASVPAASNANSSTSAPAASVSQGSVEIVSEEAPRNTGGLLYVIARHLAPTPLSEGQNEASQFKTPPFFMRRSQAEQVIYPSAAEQMASSQLGTPSPVVMTAPMVVSSGTVSVPSSPTVLPVVTTTPRPLPSTAPIIPTAAAPAPATVTTPAPAPIVTTTPMPSVPAPAPKPVSPPLVQTSYLPNAGNSMPVRQPVAQLSEPQPTNGMPQYVRDLIFTVRNGTACEEGLAAAFSLANSDWRAHPDVVLALATAAKTNPMLPVRVTAIRCLGAIRVNTTMVRTTLQGLKNDTEPSVRSEAERALNSLVFYAPPRDSVTR
jgi:hypothetical protein